VRRLIWDLGSGTWELGACTPDVSSWGVIVLWFASGCSVGFGLNVIITWRPMLGMLRVVV
jgi:hypothetical protein